MSEAIKEYYDMWLLRMQNGHNNASRAIHYGYQPNPAELIPSEAAKLETNKLVARSLDIATLENPLIADLGCGIAGTALHISEIFPHSRILAVNFHLAQLNYAQSFLQSTSRVELVNANFMRLPMATASLDGAYAIESSCYADDKFKFYAETMRCLKPGRNLVIFDVFSKRLPQNPTEESLLRESCAGWVVPNWHTVPDQTIFTHFNFQEITTNLIPDLQRSYTIAQEKISATNSQLDSITRGHLQAIVSGYKCFELGLIQYGLLVATKQ